MGASKSRACSTCTVQMCTHKRHTKIPRDNHEVDTNICRPRPKFERKLVSFSKCGDNNCLPGNRKHCNCRTKCVHRRQCENSNACKCQKKHECIKVPKISTCKSYTGENNNTIRGNGDLKEPIYVTGTVNCGAVNKNEVVNEAINETMDEAIITQSPAKSQAKNEANDSQTSTVTGVISNQSAVKFSTNCSQNPAEVPVETIISQHSDSETAQQTVYNLCIAINEQLIQLKQTKMPYLDKNSLKQNYEDVGREVNKLCKTLTYEKNSQKFDAHSILVTAKGHQTRFECIKNKHERLRHRFKNHRKSLLFYICQFLSCCCDC